MSSLYHSSHSRRAVSWAADDTLEATRSMLRSASLSAGTVQAYRAAVDRWQDYCTNRSPHTHHPLSHDSGPAELDDCVSIYLAYVYQRRGGRGRQLGVCTIFGLYLYYPSIRRRLVESEQMLQGWARLRPSVSHPPLTWPLVTLIAVTMAANQYGHGAIATLVAFDGLLRISEVTALRVGDVSAPSDRRRGGVDVPSSSRSSVGRVLLRLAVTKTGSNQWVELYNADVSHLLLRRIQHRPNDALVFDLHTRHRSSNPASAYRRAFRVVCNAVGLGACHFTPHSLRHGGATHAMQHLGQSIDTVMHRGRWRSESSTRTYLQAGRAQLLQQSIPAAVLANADRVSQDWYSDLRHLLSNSQ
jgi:integrase